MLAMHYSIELKDDAAVEAVRARAAERGPWFDGMAGLAHKLFLVDPTDPCYATFYLWRDPDGALAFLEGDFFAALSATYGRPEVRLLLTENRDLPFEKADRVVLDWQARKATAVVAALDPRTGQTLHVRGPEMPGRSFEVMYHARGDTRRDAAQLTASRGCA